MLAFLIHPFFCFLPMPCRNVCQAPGVLYKNTQLLVIAPLTCSVLRAHHIHAPLAADQPGCPTSTSAQPGSAVAGRLAVRWGEEKALAPKRGVRVPVPARHGRRAGRHSQSAHLLQTLASCGQERHTGLQQVCPVRVCCRQCAAAFREGTTLPHAPAAAPCLAPDAKLASPRAVPP